MDTGRVQRLVAVDVPQPAYDPLIHQQRFDLPPPGEYSTEHARGRLQRLYADLTESFSYVPTATRQAPDAAEPPWITETQLARQRRNGDTEVGMGFYRCLRGNQRKPPAHAQPEDKLRLRLDVAFATGGGRRWT